jgi:hypothetical protein
MISFLSVNAQEENQIDESLKGREVFIDDFMNIKVYSGIEIKLIPSDENKLVISGEDNISVVAKLREIHLKYATL